MTKAKVAEQFAQIPGMGEGDLFQVKFDDSANISVSWVDWLSDYVRKNRPKSTLPKSQSNSDKLPLPKSLTESARAKIDGVLIKNRQLGKCTVWIAIAASVYSAAHMGSKLGAYSAGTLLEAMANQSERMPPEELEKLVQEGVGAGTLAGFGAGMLAAGIAAADVSVTVAPAAGIMGWMGATTTTTVATFSTGAVASIGAAVALPVAILAAGAYVAINHGRSHPRSHV